MRTMYQQIIRYLEERDSWQCDWADELPYPAQLQNESEEHESHMQSAHWDELLASTM